RRAGCPDYSALHAAVAAARGTGIEHAAMAAAFTGPRGERALAALAAEPAAVAATVDPGGACDCAVAAFCAGADGDDGTDRAADRCLGKHERHGRAAKPV